jgi:hypothetical protein
MDIRVRLYWWLKVTVFCGLLVFYVSLIAFKIVLPAAEDLPRQMMNGKDILAGNWEVVYKNVYSYTDPDHEFANHHWLYGVYAYGLYEIAGYEGHVIVKIVTLLAAFCLIFHAALRRADFWLVALAAIPVILILAGRSGARPEMFSYLFIALYIWLLTYLDHSPRASGCMRLSHCKFCGRICTSCFHSGVALVGAYWLQALVYAGRKAFYSPLVAQVATPARFDERGIVCKSVGDYWCAVLDRR